jgi:mono/diheme cytochrome c family protein
MRARAILVAAGLAAAPALADPAAEQLAFGATTYKQFCSHCHGIGMANPGTSSYDLRQWPTDQRESFYDAVLNGRGSMPAWGDILLPEEMDALWRYVATRGGTEPFPEEATAGAESAEAPAPLPTPSLLAEGTLTACLPRNGGVMSARRHDGGIGMDYEVAAAVAERLGLALDVTWYEAEVEEDTTPARDTIALLSYGLCDLAPGFALYEPILGKYDGARVNLPRWDDRYDNDESLRRNPTVALRPIAVSRPYVRMEIGLVHREGVEPGEVRSVADLDGLRLGVEQGTLPGVLTLRQGTQAMARAATTLSPGPTFLWEMEKGAFDAALMTVGAYDYHRRQNPITTLRLHPYRHPLGFNLGIATLAENEGLTAAVDAALGALAEEGAFPGLAEASGLHYAEPRAPYVQSSLTMRDILEVR